MDYEGHEEGPYNQNVFSRLNCKEFGGRVTVGDSGHFMGIGDSNHFKTLRPYCKELVQNQVELRRSVERPDGTTFMQEEPWKRFHTKVDDFEKFWCSSAKNHA